MPVAMKAIIPRSFLGDAKKLARIVENALTAIAEDIATDFEVTVDSWKKQPEFSIAKRPGERVIATTSEVYRWINDGTRPHVIVARRGKTLRFSPGGSPKTTPRVIGSDGGGKGSGVVFVRRVNHPGTVAREFDTTIATKWRKRAPQVLQRAIDSEVR